MRCNGEACCIAISPTRGVMNFIHAGLQLSRREPP
jgi:hypothetical protein